jgi:hypothetical protein
MPVALPYGSLLFFVPIVIVVVIIVRNVFVFILVKILVIVVVFLDVVLFLIFFVGIVGNRIERNRMRLRNFKLRFTFRAAQDFAFFNLVFIHINFRGTLRAAEHVSTLRFDLGGCGLAVADATFRRIIYPSEKTNEAPSAGHSVTQPVG